MSPVHFDWHSPAINDPLEGAPERLDKPYHLQTFSEWGVTVNTIMEASKYLFSQECRNSIGDFLPKRPYKRVTQPAKPIQISLQYGKCLGNQDELRDQWSKATLQILQLLM